MNQLLFKIEKQGWVPGVRIHVAIQGAGRLSIAQPAKFETREEDVCETGLPLLYVENLSDLQSLMDQLWQLGMRPSDIGTPGHLAATQAHLSDMRRLVQKTLDVQL